MADKQKFNKENKVDRICVKVEIGLILTWV